MHTHPRLSKSGVELVKRFEGLRRTAAQLPAGGWTIGSGHTISARQGAEVSPEDAEALLLYDLGRTAKAVDAAIFTPVNQNQYDALVAFAFNVGIDNFLRSNVLKRLNEGSYLQAAAAIEMWRRADIQGDSIVVDGLVRRRAAEKALFLTPPEGFRPTPTPVVRPEYDAAPELFATQASLANAAEVHVPMQGEATHARVAPPPEPEPPPPVDSPVTAASRNVSARLSQILAAEPPPIVAPVPSVPVGPFPDEDDAELIRDDEAPERVEAEAEPVATLEPPPRAYQPPQPRLYQPPEPLPAPPSYDDEPAVEVRPEHRFPNLSQRAAAQPIELEAPTSSLSLGVLALGVFGAALFCGALATMVFGRATLVNLALGLLGVACMVPAGLKLLTQLFTARSSADRDGLG